MREPLNGHASSGHLDSGGLPADEISRLATPVPAPLTYSDQSPDTARREPTGRQSVVGAAKDEAEKLSPMDVKGRIRQVLLGKAQAVAGGAGELLGQTLGQLIQISILTEDRARELADSARHRFGSVASATEPLTTGASHSEQRGAGTTGSLLTRAREQVASVRARRPVARNPLAVALLAGTLGLGGVAAVWLLLAQRRRRAERQAATQPVPTAPLDGHTTPRPSARRRRLAPDVEVIEILE